MQTMRISSLCFDFFYKNNTNINKYRRKYGVNRRRFRRIFRIELICDFLHRGHFWCPWLGRKITSGPKVGKLKKRRFFFRRFALQFAFWFRRFFVFCISKKHIVQQKLRWKRIGRKTMEELRQKEQRQCVARIITCWRPPSVTLVPVSLGLEHVKAIEFKGIRISCFRVTTWHPKQPRTIKHAEFKVLTWICNLADFCHTHVWNCRDLATQSNSPISPTSFFG